MPADSQAKKPAQKSASQKSTAAKGAPPRARKPSSTRPASPPPAPPRRSRRLGIVLTVVAVGVLAALAMIAFRPAAGPGPEFVTRDGEKLMLNGEEFRYASTNTYELMFGQPITVDAYFTRMTDNGFNVLRTWAFYDVASEDGQGGVEIANKGTWFQYFNPETGAPGYNDGKSGLEKLDYVIYSAGQHDVKLILPFVNNWTSFGGMDQYVQWAGGQWHDDFVTNEQIKTWYKAWVDHLLNRTNSITGIKYKDDPTIMAWELANEMRCSSSGPYASSADCNARTILAWADEMSTYVKSIDSNHLVSFGSEAFLCDTRGGDYWLTNCSQSADPVEITALPNIDIHGIHIYPDHWDPTEPTDDWADWSVWWIERHGEIASNAGKPFYIGEYGWRGKQTRLPVFNDWLAAAYESGADGTNFWMMQPTNPGLVPPDNDGFVVYCPSAVCTLVAHWNDHVQNGTDWNTFGPIGDTDVTTTTPNTPVSLNIVQNDMAFGDATLDLDSIDLDPALSGVQSTVAMENGSYVVEGGVVTFTPNLDATGSARVYYTVSDSEGRATEEIALSVVIVASSQ